MDKRIKQYSATLQSMIQFETISSEENNDVEKFRKFHKLLKKNFPNVFSKCEIEDYEGSLLIRWPGNNSERPVMFMNHQDVVEATGEWKYPPFAGKLKDGILWGRGTIDTKGGLFAMLQAADELINDGFVPEQDIYFESGANEEQGGAGAKHFAELLKKNNIRFEYLIDEGGMVVEEPMNGVFGKYAMIGLGERGRAALLFTAKSNGGHASTPGKDTPLVRLGKMMAYIDKHNIFDVQINDAVVQMLKSFSYSMEDNTKYIYRYANIFKPLLKLLMPNSSPTAKAMVATTIAFTMAEGSGEANVLPESAYIVGDMRISHHEGFEKAFARVKETAAKFDVQVDVLEEAVESNVASLDSYGFKLASEAVEKVFNTGDEKVIVAPYIMNQGSDARFFSDVCDTCLRFAPLSIDSHLLETVHGVNERIDVYCLDNAVDFYKYMMTNTK